MATLDQAVETAQLWGTFESVRDHLFDQFRDPPYEPDTGLSLPELERQVEAYLQAHVDAPRVLQKAHVYRLIVTQAQICIDPEDWFVDKLNHGHILRELGERWLREAQAGPIAEEAHWFDRALEMGLCKGGLDTGHISPGWDKMFAKGLSGLLDEARHKRDALGVDITEAQAAFYEAVEIVYEATLRLGRRFADLARRMVRQDPAHAPRLLAIAETCGRVPAHAPQTLHQALQFHWLMHELIEMEGELVRSAGHFDRHMLPYYRADLAAGRLTCEQAIELIQFFWYKHHARTQGVHNGKNFVFAGQYADGSEVVNELTYVGLDAYERLRTPDPKLSVRFTPQTPDALYRRVAELIRSGLNAFVLMNDVPAVEALIKRGKTLEDARSYLPIGCYEPAVDGKETGCTMNLTLNLAKAVEFALHDGRDPLTGEQVGPHTGDPLEFGSFEALFAAYSAQIAFLLERCMAYIRAHERQWSCINPSPLLAATIDDCLTLGKDVGQGGAHYNSTGFVGMALANTCDSLLALKRTVYDDRRHTMAEMLDALAHDYAGYEAMRLYLLNRVPKWGNGDPEADALARRIADHYCAHVHTLRNERGGGAQAALFSLVAQWTLGRETGALPDGRKAREPLAGGVGAMPGRDKAGVTGLIESVTGLDYRETPNGAVLDVTLHPSAVRGEEGLQAFVDLIKTFMARGGYAVQFNIYDADMLRDAQRHPERHAALQIRVTGWSVFFVTLSQYEQERFIERTQHRL